MAQGTDDDRCRMITEVAIEEAQKRCNSEDAVRAQLERIVGMDGMSAETDCEAILDTDLGPEILDSTRRTRQWVMCRAWKLVNEDDMALASAVSQSWAEANAAGEEIGIEV